MDDAAGSSGSVVELAGIAPGVGDELLERARRQRRFHAENVGARAEDADRDKVLLQIVVRLLDERRNDDLRRRSEQQGVPVGGGMGDAGGADRTARAGDVLNDDGLAELRSKALADDACHGVGIAAGGVGNHRGDRPGRPLAGLRRANEQRRCADTAKANLRCAGRKGQKTNQVLAHKCLTTGSNSTIEALPCCNAFSRPAVRGPACGRATRPGYWRP